MRLVVRVVALGAAVLLAACSSSPAASPQPASSAAESSAPASAMESSAPAASEAPSAVGSSATSSNAAAGMAAASGDFARISQQLAATQAQIMAKLGTATSPGAMSDVYKEWGTALRSAIAEYRKIDWPATISGDMNKLLDDEDSLAAIIEKIGTDPTGIADNQAQMSQLSSEMATLSKKIAGELGAPLP